jgi:hypothetical protein
MPVVSCLPKDERLHPEGISTTQENTVYNLILSFEPTYKKDYSLRGRITKHHSMV